MLDFELEDLIGLSYWEAFIAVDNLDLWDLVIEIECDEHGVVVAVLV